MSASHPGVPNPPIPPPSGRGDGGAEHRPPQTARSRWLVPALLLLVVVLIVVGVLVFG